MPRKKRANVRNILQERIQEPDTAKKIVDALLSFLGAPDKAKAADVLKLLDFAAEESGKPSKGAELPDASEDLTQYADAQLWDWLKRLEGGKARGP